jgi:hypothetical protein
MKWYKCYDNVTYLGGILCYKKGFRVEELQYYYENPWKYTGEGNETKGEYDE